MERIISGKVRRWALLVWVALMTVSAAHKMQMIRGDLEVSPGSWTADLWIEGWALYPEFGPLALPGDPREPGVSGPEWMAKLDEIAWGQMKEIGDYYLKDSFKPSFDGKPLEFEVTFPDLEKSPLVFRENQDGNSLVQCRMTGELPDGAVGDFRLSWKDDDETPLALTIHGHDGEKVLRLESGIQDEVIYTISPAGDVEIDESSLSIIGWIKQGFLHILPKGLDHILFILGLFLLQPKFKPLLWQTSAFTVAHSITLALVVLGAITVPGRFVEAMIALSIAYVGIENLWVKELKPWRVFFIFALGLLHGMGFASVMKELEIPEGSVLQPLIGFNVGVELGQISVLLGAFALTFWAVKKAGFEIFRKVASGLIAIVGLYWTVERLMF